MANNIGTIVGSTVRPPTTKDQFPVVLSREAKGGYVAFDTIEQRDAHPSLRREPGMIAYVASEDKEYRLLEDLTTWVEKPSGGGTASSVAWADVTGKPTTFTPSAHSHSMSDVTGLSAALGEKLDANEKGSPNGVAELGNDGKILPSQLPGGLNSVIESYVVGLTPFASDWLSDTEGGSALTPASSTIYSVMTAGAYQYKTYMWGGSSFIEVSPSLVLGETSNTAYRGDRGKIAYEHSQADHAPANAQKNSDITKAEIEDKLTGEISSHNHPASDYPYTNEDYPMITTQNQGIDRALYKEITFSYTKSIILDLGLQLTSLPVTGTLNKTAEKLETFSINSDPGGANTVVNLKTLMTGAEIDTDVVISPPRSAYTTFPITISTLFESVVKNITVNFYNRKYYGFYGTAGNDLPSVASLVNGSWEWASSRSISLTTAQTASPNGLRFWYVYPNSLGAASLTENGFAASWEYMLFDMVTPGGITVQMRAYFSPVVKNSAFSFTAS